MNLKPLYLTCKLLLLFIILAAIGVVGVMIWLGVGSRDISSLNPYITPALQLPNVESHVTIGTSRLQWESFDHPAVVRLDDIVLHTKQGPFVTVPHISVKLNIWQAIMGTIVPEDLTIEGADVTLVRKKDGAWVWVGQGGEAIALSRLLAQTEGEDGAAVPLSGVTLRDSQLMVYDEARDFSLHATDLQAEWQTLTDGNHQIQMQSNLSLNDQKTNLKARMNVDPEQGAAKVILDIAGFNPAVLCDLLKQCEELPVLSMPLSGTVALVMAQDFNLDQIIFALTGEKGTFAYQPHFPETLELDSMAITGKVHQAMRQIDIEQITLALGETKVTAGGSFITAEEGYFVTLDASGEHMPVNDLYKYWPATLAPESREWATTSIRDGLAERASASVRLEPEDFATENFPDDFLSTEIVVKDGTVHYLPGFPKAEGVDAVVRFTGTTMVAESSKGRAMTGSTLPKAKIVFTDLNAPGTPMEIALEVESPAKDVITFLQPPRFDILSKLPIDLSKASGQAKGTINLAFDAFSGNSEGKGIDWDRVKYDINADLANLSGISYQDALKISNASGPFAASNDAISIALDGTMNGAPLAFGYKQDAKSGEDYMLKGTVSDAVLALFGLGDEVPLTGAIGVDAAISGSGATRKIDATLNLNAAALEVEEIGYRKEKQVPATLTIKNDVADPAYWLFTYKADALTTDGRLGVDWEQKALVSLVLNHLVYGRNDLSLEYKSLHGDDFITLKGKAIDLAAEMEKEEADDTLSISGLSHVRLDLDVQTVHMPQEQVLNHVKGHLDCTGERCESADITATFAESGGMLMKIARDNGQRRFHLQSDNTGNMMRAFDMVEELHGGTLEIRGAYDESKPGNPLDGTLTLTSFTLKDAPILSRILNMSSLTGLMQTLSGQGIGFDKMRADFVFVDDVVTVKNGRAAGASLGILADGTINVKAGTLDMDGSLAPAYVLNSMVSKIPIIGELLAGGKGESVFAVNFSVEGDANDPQVVANPLSVLTPGFTRKFFDVFDGDKPAEPAAAEPEKKVETPAQESAQEPLTIEVPALKDE